MENIDTPLVDWLLRAKRKANAHAYCASRCDLMRKVTGIPSVILSAITGTAVVAQQTAKDPTEWSWWVVALVIVAAIVTAVQAFLNHGARAEQHKAASAAFGALRRKIQCAIDRKEQDCPDKIDSLRQAFDELSASEPIIPNRIWKDVQKKYPSG